MGDTNYSLLIINSLRNIEQQYPFGDLLTCTYNSDFDLKESLSMIDESFDNIPSKDFYTVLGENVLSYDGDNRFLCYVKESFSGSEEEREKCIEFMMNSSICANHALAYFHDTRCIFQGETGKLFIKKIPFTDQKGQVV